MKTMETQDQVAKRRKGGRRRKTGCFTCRSRHSRCDEKKPICGSCERLGLSCQATDIIVPSAWCSLAPEAPTKRSQHHDPSSTWEIFNRLTSALWNDSRPPTSVDVGEVNHDFATVDSEAAELLRRYQSGIAIWMDLFDHGMSYQRDVMRRVFSSQLLLNSVCALTAKQMNTVKSGEVWAPVAARYYGESLRLLIHLLDDPAACQDDALTATILLSSYELLAAPGTEYKRHLFGAMTLIKTRGIDARSKALDRASFWIYIRHDTSMALIMECPTILSPDDWNVSWADDEVEEDALGNKMLWLLGLVINVVFLDNKAQLDGTMAARRSEMSAEIDKWFERLPLSFTGARCGPMSPEGFFSLCFPMPAAAAAMLLYHLAKLLLLAEGLERPSEGSSHLQIQHHADHIASIGLSDIPDGVLVQATQPLFYAARHTDSLPKKARMWALLGTIETKLGFHTSSRVEKLQRAVQVARRNAI